MADNAEVFYIYPPNYDDADTPPTWGGWKNVCVQMTSLSDGTGETDVQKVDISNLAMLNGVTPTRTAILDIKYNVVGMSVTLEWKRNPHALIARLDSGEGHIDWSRSGGKCDPDDGTDDTGDIILTTSGADAGDTYDITMWIALKE